MAGARTSRATGRLDVTWLESSDSRAAGPAVSIPARRRSLRSTRVILIGLYAFAFFVALPLALWQLGNRLDVWLELRSINHRAWRALGALIATAGGALMLRAMWTLWRDGHGLPISHLPPTELVRTGAFGRLRHPIYVGYTLVLTGAGLFSASIGRSVWMSLFLMARLSLACAGGGALDNAAQRRLRLVRRLCRTGRL